MKLDLTAKGKSLICSQANLCKIWSSNWCSKFLRLNCIYKTYIIYEILYLRFTRRNVKQSVPVPQRQLLELLKKCLLSVSTSPIWGPNLQNRCTGKSVLQYWNVHGKWDDDEMHEAAVFFRSDTVGPIVYIIYLSNGVGVTKLKIKD